MFRPFWGPDSRTFHYLLGWPFPAEKVAMNSAWPNSHRVTQPKPHSLQPRALRTSVPGVSTQENLVKLGGVVSKVLTLQILGKKLEKDSHLSRDKDGCIPNVRLPMAFSWCSRMGFLEILTHKDIIYKYPLHRAFIDFYRDFPWVRWWGYIQLSPEPFLNRVNSPNLPSPRSLIVWPWTVTFSIGRDRVPTLPFCRGELLSNSRGCNDCYYLLGCPWQLVTS